MKRITTLLMSAGALALAACSGGDESGNNATANMTDENASSDVMFDQADSLDNVTEAAPAGAKGVDGNTAAATPDAPAASVAAAPAAAARRPTPPPKAAPGPRAEQPQATSQPAKKAEPSPPPQMDCTPEHRAAGHC